MVKFGWLAGAALLPLAAGANAQSLVTAPGSTPPLQGVTDRPHPDYDPIGGRLGSFFLYPRLDITAIRTDNLRATPTNKISDVTIDVRPSVDMVSNWGRHYLGVRTYYDRALHTKTGSEDFEQYGASAGSRLDFGRDTHLFLNGNVDRAVEPRTDINSVNASRTPIRYSSVGFGGNLTSTFNRLTLTGGSRVNLQRFRDGETLDGLPINQQFRDNTILNSSLEGRYLVGASTSVILHVERSQINYTDNSFSGFNRNSVAYSAQAGLGLQITNLLQGDIRVGYLNQNNRDLRFQDSSGLGFSANLVYNVRPTTTIRFTADRSIEPGGSTVTTGNIRSTGAVTVEHELLRNLILTGYGRYSSIDPQGQIDKAREIEGRLGAIYYLSRRFRFNAGYSHYSRRGVFGDFDVNNVSAGVTVTL